MEKSVMTLEEVAQYLRFSVEHVQGLVDTGEIPCSRVGGHLRFLKSRIEEWIREQEMKPSVFCAGCNRVFTPPSLPPGKRKRDLKNLNYIRIKRYMDGGEYYCSACFAKTKICTRCAQHFLPEPQSPNPNVCSRCATLDVRRKK